MNISHLVDALCRYSNNRGGAPGLEELQVLLVSAGMGGRVEQASPAPPHRIARRLARETVAEIVSKYEAGATTHDLRAEYGLAQGSVLKILAKHEATRTRSLSAEHVMRAVELYQQGFGIQRIADQIGASYTGTRNALLRSGVELRGRLQYQQKS